MPTTELPLVLVYEAEGSEMEAWVLRQIFDDEDWSNSVILDATNVYGPDDHEEAKAWAADLMPEVTGWEVTSGGNGLPEYWTALTGKDDQ